MNGQKLEKVTSFKYLGATLCKDGTCSAEIRIRIASTLAARLMARLNRIWRSNTISFPSKFKLHKSLVTSSFLYGCKIWTLLAGSKDPGFQNLFVFSTRITRLMTGGRARSTSSGALRNLFWQPLKDGNSCGVGMSHTKTASSKTSFRGTLERGQCHGWQRKCWMDNNKAWTSLPMPELLTAASYRKDWKRISAGPSVMSTQWCNQSRVWTLLNWLALQTWQKLYFVIFLASIKVIAVKNCMMVVLKCFFFITLRVRLIRLQTVAKFKVVCFLVKCLFVRILLGVTACPGEGDWMVAEEEVFQLKKKKSKL